MSDEYYNLQHRNKYFTDRRVNIDLSTDTMFRCKEQSKTKKLEACIYFYDTVNFESRTSGNGFIYILTIYIVHIISTIYYVLYKIHIMHIYSFISW